MIGIKGNQFQCYCCASAPPNPVHCPSLLTSRPRTCLLSINNMYIITYSHTDAITRVHRML